MLIDATLNYVDNIDDVAHFVAWCADLANRRAPVALDTETTGLRWWEPHFTRLVQVGTETEAWAVDVSRWRGAIEIGLGYLFDAGCPIIMWNCAFDLHALAGDGFPLPAWNNVHDAMFLHHLVIPHASHSLKPAAASYFGNAAYTGQSALKDLFARTKTDWATVDTREPDYHVYGMMDTVLTARLGRILSREAQQIGAIPLYEQRMAAREVMWRSEVRGLLVDRAWTTTLRSNWTAEAVRLAVLLEEHGIKNPASNAQITGALEQIEWEPDEWTPTGAAKLDKTVLAQLAVVRPEWADIALPVLRYRRLTKWIGAYLNHFIDDVDSAGRLHHSIRTLRAVTGRDSITDPPMQTLPSRDDGAWMIRRCIIPSPGHKLWACDYNSQEARLFAHYSQDPGMIACIQRNEDLYTYVAREVYGDQSITKKDDRRAATKIILLAFLYGAGIDKLSKASGLNHSETEAFVRRLFDLFPNVRDLTGDHAIGGSYPGGPALAAAHRGSEEGIRYILTKAGRRFSVPSDQELYKCVNGLMQGSGADILSEAICRLDQVGYGDNIVLPVHDELILEFPEGEEAGPKEAAALMEDHSLSVPITTELSGPFDSWGDHYMPEGP